MPDYEKTRLNARRTCNDRGYKRGDVLFSDDWGKARRIVGLTGPQLKLTGSCVQQYNVSTLPMDVRIAGEHEDTRFSVLTPTDVDAIASAVRREMGAESPGPKDGALTRLRAVYFAAEIALVQTEAAAADKALADLNVALLAVQRSDLA